MEETGTLLFLHRHFNPEPAQIHLIVKMNGHVQIQVGEPILALNEIGINGVWSHRTDYYRPQQHTPANTLVEIFWLTRGF
jgi:hypothetical protein